MVLLMTFGFISCKAEVVPTYTVTYSSEHGTAPGTISVEENTILTESQLPALSDGTWVFKGWYVNNVKVVAGEYQVAGNVTLTAHWTAMATVSYHSKFGTVPQSFEREASQTLTEENLDVITCSPYTFLGWYYDKDDDDNGTGTQAQAGDAISADVSLYAKWQTATVSFNSVQGTVPSIKKYTGEKITESEIPPASFDVRPGYTFFYGWVNGFIILTTNYTVNGDITFTEQWSRSYYTITFNANGGIGDDYTQSVIYGITSKLNANTFFRDDGYVFDGWNRNADGSGTSYEDEADFTITEANNITLYAHWEPIADETTIVNMIKNMTESGTIAAKGTFSNDLIRQINSALKTLPDDVRVFLDLSNVTGLSELEAASSTNENYSFYGCTNLKGIILPNGVTSIGDSAFKNCSRLTTITIPSSTTSIGDSAFAYCYLRSIVIPTGVTSIGNYTFSNNAGLRDITLPESLLSIGDYAFNWCGSIVNITIPSGVASIGANSFLACYRLTDITFEDTSSKWYYTTDSNYTNGTEIGPMSNDSSTNATLLKGGVGGSYVGYYFYKE